MERRQPSHCIENSTTPSYFSIQFSIENHSKWHLSFCQFEWWRGDSRGIVSRTRLTSFYFSIQFSIENHLPSKERRQARSDTEAKLCQFEWWRGDSRVIVSRTRLNSSYFSIHFACFFKTNKTLEVTLKQHFVSSSDGEATAEPLYRELDKPRLTSRYNFLSKITCLPRNAGRLEVTLKQYFVSSSDFMGFERNLMKSYRELDLTHLTSR
jgi:hypothetical protein